MAVRRLLQPRLRALAKRFPVVTITGPRQSGKTTLARAAFPSKPYANLEAPDLREFAESDPRGFLGQYPRGAVLDEIQRVPKILSFLQERVDRTDRAGEFVLTGSQHFGLLDGESQSLAGRTAVAHLLPLGLDEVRLFPRPPEDLLTTVWTGGYPRIHDRGLPPHEWLASYTATYVERDVRTVLNVGNLTAFQTFLRLCAGRSGQILNLSALGADCGISHNTARAWLTVLETAFLVFRLPAFAKSLRRRLTRTPKLYFGDSGLLCYLLGIRNPEELRLHPLRGAIFESWVLAEITKARVHRGLEPGLCYYREHKGAEVDAILEDGARTVAVEIKSGQTVARDFFDGLRAFESATGARKLERVVVYGGDEPQRRTEARVVPWSEVASFAWARGG